VVWDDSSQNFYSPPGARAADMLTGMFFLALAIAASFFRPRPCRGERAHAWVNVSQEPVATGGGGGGACPTSLSNDFKRSCAATSCSLK
jgi:hypothetical protein